MTYLELPPHKTALLGASLLFLVASVHLTFNIKQSYYGMSSFGQIIEWVGSNMVYDSTYRLDRIARTDGLVAALAGVELTRTSTSTEPARAVPVLMYHSIGHVGEEQNFTRASFSEQMHALAKAGWRSITLAEFEAYMQSELSLPERSFLLTFDDGAKQSYHPVDPVLRATGFNAVSFLLPKYSNGPGTHYYLSGNEIEKMLGSGRWEIGSHGQNVHEFLPIDDQGTLGAALANRAWLPEQGRLETDLEYATRVDHDLRTSRHDLERRFAVAIRSFAFPFGEFGQLSANHRNASRVLENIVARHYELAFYQWWEGEGFSQNYRSSEPARLYKRLTPEASWSGRELVALLEQGVPKSLPYHASLDEHEGWLADWGTVHYPGSGLTLRTKEAVGTGATVILDGTGHWRDYRVTTRVRSPNQNGATVIVRFRDPSNHAFCNVGRDFVHLEQVQDGERRVIKGYREVNLAARDTFDVSVVVQGRTITCGIDGEAIVSSEFLDATLQTGGVGVKTWNPVPGTAELTVLDLVVEPLDPVTAGDK